MVDSDKPSVLISGGTHGLGRALAESYFKRDCAVFVFGRDPASVDRTVFEIRSHVPGSGDIKGFIADVSRLDQVEGVVYRVLDETGRIDVLVSNAGIYGPIGPVESTHANDWDHAININLNGSVNLIRAVIPNMKKQRTGRIIQLSGGGATKPMPNFTAYAAAKAGVVRFVESVAEELREFRVPANSVAPGALNTRMLRQVIDSGPSRVGESFFKRSKEQDVSGEAGFEKAIQLIMYLSFESPKELTGRLISAIWDDWKNTAEIKDVLANSDRWTLRRFE